MATEEARWADESEVLNHHRALEIPLTILNRMRGERGESLLRQVTFLIKSSPTTCFGDLLHPGPSEGAEMKPD